MASFAVLSDSSKHGIFKNGYINKALVELGLEGISVPTDMMDDLALLDTGKMTREEFFDKAVKKAKQRSLEKQLPQKIKLKHAM